MGVAASSEEPATTAVAKSGGTGTGIGFDLDPYLFVILATVDVGALIILILAQFIHASAEVYAAIFVNYGLLAVLMTAFTRIAVLVRRGKDPDPDPHSWQNGQGGGGGPSGTYIILALILATVGIILIFTGAYYLTNAPSYLSPGPSGPFKNTWQQTMFLAVGVMATVQSPPLIVSWAGGGGPHPGANRSGIPRRSGHHCSEPAQCAVIR